MTSNANITIALVDDSRILRTFLSRYLSGQGFAVVMEADDGMQLLTALTDGMPPPDLCLLDTNMPGMDGYETARRLKQQFPAIRIMAFSYLDDEANAQQLLSNGAHAYICKEIAAGALRDALKSLYRPVVGEDIIA